MGSCKLPLRSFFQLTTDVPASVHDPSNGYRVSIRVDRVENQIVFDTEEPHALAVPRLIPIQRIALWQALQRTGLSQELLRDRLRCVWHKECIRNIFVNLPQIAPSRIGVNDLHIYPPYNPRISASTASADRTRPVAISSMPF